MVTPNTDSATINIRYRNSEIAHITRPITIIITKAVRILVLDKLSVKKLIINKENVNAYIDIKHSINM